MSGYTKAVVASRPVGVINVSGWGLVEPLDDITAKESAMLSIMLTSLVGAATWGLCNPQEAITEYIEKHGLQRHFKKE